MVQLAIRFLLILSLFVGGRIQLRAQNPVLETVSTPAGIDPLMIADIRQDRQGYLWLATGSGLLRFDGYTWNIYQHDPKNKNSLSGDNLRTVCPTRDGLIWTGGWSSGLDCLDPETGKITHHQLVQRKEYKYEENAITALTEDHLGNLWIGTAAGLFRLEKSTGHFIPYLSVPKNPRTLSHPHVSCIYEDKQGTIWVGTGDQGSTQVMEGGLNKLDRKTATFTRYLHHPANPASLTENRVLTLFEDSRGVFWVGTGGDGLHTLDRKTNRFTRYPFQENHLEQLSRPFAREKNLRKFGNSGIQFIIEDPAGAIWIGTIDAGANRYDPKTKRVTSYKSPADGLPDFNLLSACRSRDGTLWIGTLPGHLIKISAARNLVEKVNMTSGVHCFEEDSSGTLWIGTISGLTVADSVTRQARAWLGQVKTQTQLLTDHVTRLNSDREGNRWISTWNNGLYQYQPSTKQFKHYQHDSLAPSTISPGEAAGFYHDRSGTRWVLTAGGLDQFDPGSATFKHYRHQDRDTNSISNHYALAVLEDHTGAFWVGTNGGGLNLMDRETGKFRHFLPWSIVTQLVEDSDGILWVASSLGLHRYDRKHQTFIAFTDPGSGKPLSFVKALIEDNEGNLWAATSNGMVSIGADRKSMRLFGSNYGIPPAEDFFFGGSFKRRDGSLYFGSMERYFHFHPEALLHEKPNRPLLNLSALRVHNQLIKPGPGSPLPVTLPHARMIALAHDQNVFSIDFAAIDFRHPELHLYTYKLENYDLDWHPVSTDRTANYFNVPPGEYRFCVRAAGSDGIWVEKSINVTISPPWWRTPWAYALYFFVLTAIFLGGWRLLLRREQAANEVKIRELKAGQLLEMDRLRSDFFANITHEFRTPLTLIISPLEHWLSKIPADDPYAAPFRSMQRNSQRLLHLVNQLLDLSKLEAGKMQLELQPGDLIYFISRITYSFRHTAESRGIELDLAAPAGSLWLNFDADKLEKIVANLLSNAVKFTPDNGRISVSLQIAPNPENLKNTTEKPVLSILLKVKDSGIGIPADELDRIFDRFHQVDTGSIREQEGSGIGLALTKELVELQGGTITASSVPGRGSEFIVTLALELLHPAQQQHISSLSNQTEPLIIQEQKEVKAIEKNASIIADPHPERPLVLVVEDNADLLEFVTRTLVEQSGYRVLEAVNGAEGYQLAREHIPDLVISDIMMPKMAGTDLCQRLKTDQHTSHIPVILLTAKTSAEHKLHGLETGADDYLTKPFEVKELLVRVANLIELRRQLKARYGREVVLQPSNIAISSIDEQFLTRALAIIEQFMADEQFNVEIFGREIGMSRMQLYRKLHALTGQAPSDFIRTIRLQRAAQLLAANSATVSEIAGQVGFGSHSYFSKCFQEQYGKTPSAFVAGLDRHIN